MELPLTPSQKIHLAITGGAVGLILLLLLEILKTVSNMVSSNPPLPVPLELKIDIAMLAGALGGIGHEFAQSGGTIAFYKIKDDGLYLGSSAGLVLGLIAGLLFVSVNSNQPSDIILFQSLLAGLALKGVSEAVGGQVVPRTKEAISIENVAPGVVNNPITQLTITVRNVGELEVKIARIYVETQAFDIQPNKSIYPGSSADFTVENISPPLAPGTHHPIRVVTAKGTIEEGST